MPHLLAPLALAAVWATAARGTSANCDHPVAGCHATFPGPLLHDAVEFWVAVDAGGVPLSRAICGAVCDAEDSWCTTAEILNETHCALYTGAPFAPDYDASQGATVSNAQFCLSHTACTTAQGLAGGFDTAPGDDVVHLTSSCPFALANVGQGATCHTDATDTFVSHNLNTSQCLDACCGSPAWCSSAWMDGSTCTLNVRTGSTFDNPDPNLFAQGVRSRPTAATRCYSRPEGTLRKDALVYVPGLTEPSYPSATEGVRKARMNSLQSLDRCVGHCENCLGVRWHRLGHCDILLEAGASAPADSTLTETGTLTTDALYLVEGAATTDVLVVSLVRRQASDWPAFPGTFQTVSHACTDIAGVFVLVREGVATQEECEEFCASADYNSCRAVHHTNAGSCYLHVDWDRLAVSGNIPAAMHVAGVLFRKACLENTCFDSMNDGRAVAFSFETSGTCRSFTGFSTVLNVPKEEEPSVLVPVIASLGAFFGLMVLLNISGILQNLTPQDSARNT